MSSLPDVAAVGLSMLQLRSRAATILGIQWKGALVSQDFSKTAGRKIGLAILFFVVSRLSKSSAARWAIRSIPWCEVVPIVAILPLWSWVPPRNWASYDNLAVYSPDAVCVHGHPVGLTGSSRPNQSIPRVWNIRRVNHRLNCEQCLGSNCLTRLHQQPFYFPPASV